MLCTSKLKFLSFAYFCCTPVKGWSLPKLGSTLTACTSQPSAYLCSSHCHCFSTTFVASMAAWITTWVIACVSAIFYFYFCLLRNACILFMVLLMTLSNVTCSSKDNINGCLKCIFIAYVCGIACFHVVVQYINKMPHISASFWDSYFKLIGDTSDAYNCFNYILIFTIVYTMMDAHAYGH